MSGDVPKSTQSPSNLTGMGPKAVSQADTSANTQPSSKSLVSTPIPTHLHGDRSQTQDPTTLPPIAMDPRDRPGSSRTKIVTLPPTGTGDIAPSTHSVAPAQRSPSSPSRAKTYPLPTSSSTAEAESSLPPYRSPEPVYDPPEEHPEGFVPGVLEEHDGDDFSSPPPDTPPPASGYASPINDNADVDVSRWQKDIQPGYEVPAEMNRVSEPDRPQLGPGMTTKRVLDKIHEHPLVKVSSIMIPPRRQRGSQPSISNVPQASWGSAKKSPDTPARPVSATPLSPAVTGSDPAALSVQTTGTLDYDHIRTEHDVREALPGGVEGHEYWYFCWQCCLWFNIRNGEDGVSVKDGKIHATDPITGNTVACESEWDIPPESADGDTAFNPIRGEAYLRDFESAREAASSTDGFRHLHEIQSAPTVPAAQTLERVDAGEEVLKFPHTIPGMDVDPAWLHRPAAGNIAKLYLSCGTKHYIGTEAGPIAGQLPPALVKAFIQEKNANPNVGATPNQSMIQALQLLMTLLSNPLFKGQRGWVKLENAKFQAKIGSSILSSLMLYHIGFGCREGPEGLTVGPLSLGKEVTEDGLLQQDRYMMRTWVELAMILQGWRDEYDENEPLDWLPITVTSLDEAVNSGAEKVGLELVPTLMESLKIFGMSPYDPTSTIPVVYARQIACDFKNRPKYLGAIDRFAKYCRQGADRLHLLVATERSMGAYTDTELQNAYEKIGYTETYASSIYVEAHEAPDDEILRMHRIAVQSCTTPSDKAEMGHALELIGRHRNNSTMRRLGGSGSSLMSLEEAYAALSAPPDSIDDGLIMQYEMAVNDYPGKAEHYRSCLEIIANSGEARQGLKRYLETGSKEPEVIKRNDIPAGLHNIGNTCYLNSILQYLYSIKPLREAVMTFKQDTTPVKPEVERSKRFVHQLRLLFLQLYKTDAPAVRPDEELAYLAITRPEIDEIVEPEDTKQEPGSIIDNLPNVGSPSSTCVNTPNVSRPSSPLHRELSASRSSVLGKRVSQDRDTSRSPGDRPKKSDGFERLREEDLSSEAEHDFEMVDAPEEEKSKPIHQEFAESQSAAMTDAPSSAPSTTADMDIDRLKLKSPEIDADPAKTDYAPPSGPPPLPPRPRRASKGTLNAGLKFGLQQDSAEVLINVLSQLETAFEPPKNADGTKGHNIIADLFSCEYRQQLIYKTAEGTVDAQTPVNSVFVHPIIGVEEEGKDLYDCLGELYLGGADIEYEGKKGHMMDLMDKFPPMFYIQMSRSQYDYATGRERKTNTHIPFGQTLAMDRFLADADADRRQKSIEITRDMTKLRSRLHDLRKQAPLSLPATFDHLHDALQTLQVEHEDLDVTPEFLAVLKDDKKEVEREIQETQDAIPALKASLERLWSGDKVHEYELVSVFMHRGKTSGAGHYWTYQSHLPDHPERFFKYNDETVTEVPAEEVLQDRTGSDANPALLCYVRKGQNLVDTLHREIWELEQAGTLNPDVEVEGTGDVEMGAAESDGQALNEADVEMPMDKEEEKQSEDKVKKPLIDFEGEVPKDEDKKDEDTPPKAAEGNLIDLDD